MLAIRKFILSVYGVQMKKSRPCSAPGRSLGFFFGVENNSLCRLIASNAYVANGRVASSCFKRPLADCGIWSRHPLGLRHEPEAVVAAVVTIVVVVIQQLSVGWRLLWGLRRSRIQLHRKRTTLHGWRVLEDGVSGVAGGDFLGQCG